VLSRFVLGGLLGTGASASVFEATDSQSGDVVALKVLHPQLALRNELSQRFLEEALNISQVRHPNLTNVIEWGTDSTAGEDVTWIAYERASGICLAEYVELNGSLHIEDAVTMTRGVLAAARALHRAGLVHRDISPTNVILEIDTPGLLRLSDVRLIDYGLVGKIGTTTRNSSGVVGNPHFISPEQARGDGVYASGDIYQIGAVLYFALTGHTPFSAQSTEELLSAHATLMPPVASSVVQGIPRELDRAIVKSLLKSPTMRFRNTDEFDRSLSAIFGRKADESMDSRNNLVELEQTKVLVPSSPSSFVDFDRTMLLSAAFTEAQNSEITQSSVITGKHRKFRVASWLWPLSFGVLIMFTLVFSVITAQPGLPSSGLEVAQIATPSPTETELNTDSPTLIAVPDVTRLNREDALSALAQAGLLFDGESAVESSLSADSVISAEPSVGTFVKPNTRVSLIIASGRNRVPQVAGLTQQDAVRQLTEAGFAISLTNSERIPQNASTFNANDRVLLLKPNAGSLLRVGSTVIVVLETSFVEPSVSPSPPDSISMTPTPAPGN
jgi:serine/threonine-protein kinase